MPGISRSVVAVSKLMGAMIASSYVASFIASWITGATDLVGYSAAIVLMIFIIMTVVAMIYEYIARQTDSVIDAMERYIMFTLSFLNNVIFFTFVALVMQIGSGMLGQSNFGAAEAISLVFMLLWPLTQFMSAGVVYILEHIGEDEK